MSRYLGFSQQGLSDSDPDIRIRFVALLPPNSLTMESFSSENLDKELAMNVKHAVDRSTNREQGCQATSQQRSSEETVTVQAVNIIYWLWLCAAIVQVTVGQSPMCQHSVKIVIFQFPLIYNCKYGAYLVDWNYNGSNNVTSETRNIVMAQFKLMIIH